MNKIIVFGLLVTAIFPVSCDQPTGKDGKEVMVDKTWVFKKGKDGKLRIIVHKSALPFAPPSK